MSPAHAHCRELTHYKGEPDPLKGDVPSQRVRDAAREALDALFGAENGYAPTSTPAQPQLTVRQQWLANNLQPLRLSS